MVIRASAATEIRALVEALRGDDEVRREAAIARLSIIGSRAVDRLLAAYRETTTRAGRVAILRALEYAGDARTLGIAGDAMADGGDLAVAAAAVLRGLLDSPHDATAAEALDTLVKVAMDPAAPHRVRLAAFEALQDMPATVRDRVAAALHNDPDPALRARAADAPRDAATADAVWQDAIEGQLPDSPAALRDAVQARSAAAPLTTLQKLIDAIHAREGTEGNPAMRTEWTAVRGAVHQALALRGSRVAVYDLRESLEQAHAPLPVSFLTAVHVVGDESCLEALAAAHASASDERWRYQLGEAFRTLARREKITRRHGVMKRIAARWPDTARELAGQ